MFYDVNILSVFVVSLLSVAVGSIWYSPLLFGRAWVQYAGLTIADEELTSKEAVKLTVKGVVAQTIFFFGLAQGIALASMSAIPLTAVVGWLAVLLLSMLVSAVVWEKKPLLYFVVNGGYVLIALIGGASTLVYWPW